MISQVASALDAAHADGLVHRDVKPSNVLYEGDPRQRWPGNDRADFVYLVDFGIARSLAEESSLTATGHAVGTLGYMAPERFSGEPADARADVYALACTLYEALVAQPAFTGQGLAQLMFAHLHRTPKPLTAIDPALPPALDDVLAIGLAKDPARRYSSAGRLAEAARSVLRGEPARDATRTLRTDRPRHRPRGAEPDDRRSARADRPSPDQPPRRSDQPSLAQPPGLVGDDPVRSAAQPPPGRYGSRRGRGRRRAGGRRGGRSAGPVRPGLPRGRVRCPAAAPAR